MSPSARSMASAPNDTHPHPALRATFPLGEGGPALAVTDEGKATDI